MLNSINKFYWNGIEINHQTKNKTKAAAIFFTRKYFAAKL